MEYVELGGAMSGNGTILRRFAVLGIIIVSLSSFGQNIGENSDPDSSPKKQASPTSQNPKSNSLSADIYEKEDSIKSFSAHVNLIRETDVIEVFFDGKIKGPFVLKDNPNLGVFKERLAKSQKNKNQNVSVKVTDEAITSVELVETTAPNANKKSDIDSVLDDILKK